jgi:acyl carrier protein
METPADRLAKSMEITEPLRRPLYLYFSECYDGLSVGESSDTINHTKLFRELKSAEDRAEVVTAALAKKLARAVSMSIEDVDPDQPLHAFGVDSLVAVEIRSWISKEFAADIAVSEFTGGRTITSVGELVTKTSQI